MPNTDRLQPDFHHEPDSNHQQKTNSLSREIDNLQTGIRVDFDQKLSELTDLLQRFKAMVVSSNRNAANGPSSEPPRAQVIPFARSLPTAGSTLPQSEDPIKPVGAHLDSADTVDNKETAPAKTPAPSLYSAETARFENGLYKLNSQLYRFRLELDQEMEFREEPLHIHFRQESELSILLQKISNRSIEKNPDK